MSLLTPEQGLAVVAPEKTDSERNWRKLCAATLLGVVAFGGIGKASASLLGSGIYGAAKQTHALEYAGVTSNQIWVTDPQAADAAAAGIAATGANTVRIFEPDSPGQAEISNDRERLCNAAEAARENNLTLVISFLGHNKKGVNYVPGNAHAVTKFLTMANAIIWNLAGPNANQPGSNGAAACVEQPLKNLLIEPFNEVNSTDFDNNQDPAKKYAYLMSRAYPALKMDASNINQALQASPNTSDAVPSSPFNLTVLAGGLAAPHNPVGFLKEFDADSKLLGVSGPQFDMLSVHPYPADPSANPAGVELSIYPGLENELNQAYGEYMPIFYDEVGVKATVPLTKKYLYLRQTLDVPNTVSEGIQAQYYHDAFAVAALQSYVVGELIFQYRDDGKDGWTSGIENPDGSHKASYDSVTDTIHEALTGTLGG